MATSSLHPESVQSNENLLQDIAKVYVQLEALQQKGAHLWPEEEDALLLCLDRLIVAALTIEIKTPEDALAMTVIAGREPDGEGLYDQADQKVTCFAKQYITQH